MKPFILVQGPVATRSGYGNHTRDLVRSLIDMDKYDIGIISLRWGDCPMDALNAQDPKDVGIIQRIINGPVNRKPDIFIQVSVPNEFRIEPNSGKDLEQPLKETFKIGVTAGIETTIASAEFIQGCNRMDLVLATSQHAANVLKSSTYQKIDDKTQQPVGELKLETPVEVLFEGVDLDTYFKTDKLDKPIVDELSQIKEKSCYLFVGHWIKGDLGQDRKDVGMMIKTFCETFKNTNSSKRPALILKTSGAHFSICDREIHWNRIQEILSVYGSKAPSVYLLHGDLTDNEMNSLYNHPKIKAMVSFTKGEGYGRPLAEFATTGKPIIASGWSGQLDFLHKEYCTLLPGQLTKVHESAADKFILKESEWFTVNYQYASKVLKDVFKHYKPYVQKSRKMPQHIKTNFSMKQMTKRFDELLKLNKANSAPQHVGLKLPKLKKAGASNNGIKLPKLKKVTA